MGLDALGSGVSRSPAGGGSTTIGRCGAMIETDPGAETDDGALGRSGAGLGVTVGEPPGAGAGEAGTPTRTPPTDSTGATDACGGREPKASASVTTLAATARRTVATSPALRPVSAVLAVAPILRVEVGRRSSVMTVTP